MRRLLLLTLLLLPVAAHAQGLKNPLGGVNDINTLIVTVVKVGFIPALGMAAFVSVLWGGFQWITAGGSKERIQLGRSTILWVVLGILLAFAGYTMLKFLITVFTDIGALTK